MLLFQNLIRIFNLSNKGRVKQLLLSSIRITVHVIADSKWVEL